MMLTPLSNLLRAIDTWTVPPAAQGQIIERAYAVDWEAGLMVRRDTDRADRSITYYTAPAPDTFEPWQTEPTAQWRRVEK